MSLYRQASAAPAFWNTLKSLLVVTAASLLFFWGIPETVVRWQAQHQSLDWLFFPAVRWIGLPLIVIGVAGLSWAALTLAIVGRGTPLPIDAPRQLVVTGPYSRVRNPMATATLVGGIGAGFWFGSPLIMLLFVVLAVGWHVLVRPDDERRLERVFGRHYVFYRRSVHCWFPARKPWDPPEVTAPISLDEISVEPRGRRR